MDELTRHWYDITPEEAVLEDIDLSKQLDITAPLNENGERCPWPWEPQQFRYAPLGMYHCPYCDAMVMAGRAHTDYGPLLKNKPIEQIQTRTDDPGESRIS